MVGHGGGGGDVHGHRLAGVRLVRVQYEVALHGDLHAVTDTPSALVCKLINCIAANEMSANFLIKPVFLTFFGTSIPQGQEGRFYVDGCL